MKQMDYSMTVENAFKIISSAGDAQSLLFQAIQDAKLGKALEAQKKIDEANDLLLQAHHSQTQLITEEAQGNKGEYSIIMVHAQDHLMNAILMQKLTNEFCELYQRIDKECEKNES
jgi:cellobiose-specific phosphotransferase system component IIA